MQDYGGPVGFRVASRRPELVHALVAQNTNAYLAGIGPSLAPIAAYFKNPGPETETPLHTLLSLAGTKSQYLVGVPDSSLVSPDAYTFDQLLLDRPGNAAIQLALFLDYKNNLAKYDDWHRYFRDAQPPMLITWGCYDEIFTVAGAEAYLQDLPDTKHTCSLSGYSIKAPSPKKTTGNEGGHVFDSQSLPRSWVSDACSLSGRHQLIWRCGRDAFPGRSDRN